MSQNIHPLVSVIVPVYNSENNLRQMLDSIAAQTLSNIEIICVNDGSTDGSLAILNEYAANDSRIQVITQENGGAGKARNTGLETARGEYLSFLDADDFFEPDMLEVAYNKAVETNADMVVFRSDQYRDDLDEFKQVSWTLRKEHMPQWEPFDFRSITCNVFRAFIGWTWDKLFKTSFVREFGLRFQEQRTTNDMLFVFSAVVLARQIAVIDQVLAHQRRDAPTSLSNTRELSWDCFYKALCALRETLQQHDLYWQLEQDYVDYCLHACLWNLNTLQGSKQQELYDALKSEWLKDLGILDAPEEWFTKKREQEQLECILNSTLESYKERFL